MTHRQLAERVGFEPTVRYNRTPDFESGAFDHSATAPESGFAWCEGRYSSRSRPQHFGPAHVGPQHIRNRDGTVGVLIVFENGDQGTADRHTVTGGDLDEIAVSMLPGHLQLCHGLSRHGQGHVLRVAIPGLNWRGAGRPRQRDSSPVRLS